MKTLVIHPLDSSTNFLSEIYKDKPWTVISTNVPKKILKEQIKNHDRIVMLGHGTELGLIGFGRYLISSSLVYLLREKLCVCIWCYANLFVNKYKIAGFNTGMIISEHEEAEMYNIRPPYCLGASNLSFAKAIEESIDAENMLESVKGLYVGNSPIIEFNRNNLYFSQHENNEKN